MVQPIWPRSLAKVFSFSIIFLLLSAKSIDCNGKGNIVAAQKENGVSVISTDGPTIAAISSFSFNENGTISLNVLVISPCARSTKHWNNELMEDDETSYMSSVDVQETANCWTFSDNPNTSQYSSKPRPKSIKDDVHLCGIFLCWDETKAPAFDTKQYHKEEARRYFKPGEGIHSLNAIATSSRSGSSSFHCGLAENNLSHALLYCWGNQFDDGKFLASTFIDGSSNESAKPGDGNATQPVPPQASAYGAKELRPIPSMSTLSLKEIIGLLMGIAILLLLAAIGLINCIKRLLLLIRSSCFSPIDSGQSLLPSWANSSSSEENPGQYWSSSSEEDPAVDSGQYLLPSRANSSSSEENPAVDSSSSEENPDYWNLTVD